MLPHVIWEAGHYYGAKGPTVWTLQGWNILANLAQPNEPRMLFVDDVHPLDQLHPLEREAPIVPFDPRPEPTHRLTESAMRTNALLALDRLQQMPRRRRARKSGGRWSCAGFPLTTTAGDPLCLLFDLGLTYHKHELGFVRGVNILPSFYEQQQRRLQSLTRRLLPDFQLDVVLFDEQGRHWFLNPS